MIIGGCEVKQVLISQNHAHRLATSADHQDLKETRDMGPCQVYMGLITHENMF